MAPVFVMTPFLSISPAGKPLHLLVVSGFVTTQGRPLLSATFAAFGLRSKSPGRCLWTAAPFLCHKHNHVGSISVDHTLSTYKPRRNGDSMDFLSLPQSATSVVCTLNGRKDQLNALFLVAFGSCAQ